MRNIPTQQILTELIKSDIYIKHKYSFLEILRSLNVLQPWEVTDYHKCVEKGKDNKDENVENTEMNIFKKNLNSNIQRLDLTKEDVIRIVESLYN